MSNIIPFGSTALPSYLTDGRTLRDVNKDIVTVAQYPTLSIRGKVFALSQDNERKVLTKPDAPDEVVQNINVAIMRLNMNSKAYYNKRYVAGESDGTRPACFSEDGVAPSARSPEPQAKKCALCPHNVFGTRVSEDGTPGKGKACSDAPRLAVADPAHLDRPALLRVPPASIKHLREALKAVKARNIPYTAAVFRIGFVMEAASPELTFRPVGLLDEAAFQAVDAAFDSEVVLAITGLLEDESAAPAAPAAAADGLDEFDAAIAARTTAAPAPRTAAPAAKTARPAKPAVTEDEIAEALDPAPKPAARASRPAASVTGADIDAALDAAPKPAARAKPAPAAKPEPAAAPAAAGVAEDLLADIDAILADTDD